MNSDDRTGPRVRSGPRAYDPPPDGFDPHTAPDELLRRHGLPRRPDPLRRGRTHLTRTSIASPTVAVVEWRGFA